MRATIGELSNLNSKNSHQGSLAPLLDGSVVRALQDQVREAREVILLFSLACERVYVCVVSVR